MKEFSTFTISRILNLNRATLQMYIERGFIEPSIEKAKGPGTKAVFNLSDLYKIGLFRELGETGLPQKEAGEISSQVNFDDIPEKIRFFVLKKERMDNGQINKTWDWHKELPAFEDQWESVVVIDAQKIKEKVNQALTD